MITKLETPIDETTGLPYCFAPNNELPPVLAPGQNLARDADWNHQFPIYEVKTSENPALDGLGRMALTSCRVQWVSYREHHDIYNERYVGPKLPTSPESLALTLIMAEAGYIPETAIDLLGDSPGEVGLSSAERRFFWESGQVKVRDPNSVRKYLFEFVFAQELDHIHPDKLSEFLHTHDLDRRLYLGHSLAAKIVERAVEPMDAVYRDARRQGLLPPHATNNIRDFVKPRLTAGRRFGVVINELSRTLAARNRELAGIAA